MEDIISVAAKIESKIKELEQVRDSILDLSQDKADAISNYDKALAKKILELKNGMVKDFEGVPCNNLPAVLIPKVAAGICFNECFLKEAKDGGYKATLTIIEAIKAELNGYQSINRHLD
jgi:hypothetical protein